MSKAVEAFYQESGRAGRDGEPATSVVLYGPRDMSRIVCLLRLSGGRGGQSRSSRRSKFHHDLERAKQMQAYCQDKVLYPTLLYCTVQYSTPLYWAVLHSTELYCAVKEMWVHN